MLPVSFADVQAAAEILRGVMHVTPVMTSRQLNEASGATAFLKCENFQRIGAFKFRGAFHTIYRIRDQHASVSSRPPIVTLSSGNHAQGVALACDLLDLSAHIVMQRPINPVKRAAVMRYGATIYEADRETSDQILAEVMSRCGGTYVHAFNDPRVIAGQGTCMLEFLASVPDLDVLLAPIGGGGLLSGTCLAGHETRPDMEIYACEPAGALDAIQSVRENRIVPMPHPATIAEGLRTSVGDVTLPILRQHLTGFYVVDESEIVEAMRFAYERMKIVIEPSSAVALVPLLRREPALVGKRVGVIVTGGNVDLSTFFEAFPTGGQEGGNLSPGKR